MPEDSLVADGEGKALQVLPYGLLGIMQSKASRHLHYLYHQGWVNNQREGLWMNYGLSVIPDSLEDKQLKLLAQLLSSRPEVQASRFGWNSGWRPKPRPGKGVWQRVNAPDKKDARFQKELFLY